MYTCSTYCNALNNVNMRVKCTKPNRENCISPNKLSMIYARDTVYLISKNVISIPISLITLDKPCCEWNTPVIFMAKLYIICVEICAALFLDRSGSDVELLFVDETGNAHSIRKS